MDIANFRNRLMESISSDLKSVLSNVDAIEEIEGHSQYTNADIMNRLDSCRTDFLDSRSFPSVPDFEDYEFTHTDVTDVRHRIADKGEMVDDAVRETLFDLYLFFYKRERN